MSHQAAAKDAFHTLVKLWAKWQGRTTLSGDHPIPITRGPGGEPSPQSFWHDRPIIKGPANLQSFWHVANSLEAALHYAEVAESDSQELEEFSYMVRTAFLTFEQGFDKMAQYPATYWWDDIGHWGNVALYVNDFIRKRKQSLPSKLMFPTEEDCIQNAAKAWAVMKAYAWDHITWTNPPPEGGCYNHTDGVQNEVTNGVYLLLSTGLYSTLLLEPSYLCCVQNATGSFFTKVYPKHNHPIPEKVQPVTFLKAACDEYNWWQGLSWMKNGKGGVGDLINGLPIDGANTFVPTGAQTIWPAALMNLTRLTVIGYPYTVTNLPVDVLKKTAGNVLLAACARLFSQTYQRKEPQELGVLCDAPFATALNGDPIDLASQKGVFLRCLRFLDSDQRAQFNTQIGATAKAVSSRLHELTFEKLGIIPVQWVCPGDYEIFSDSWKNIWGPGAYATKWEPDLTYLADKINWHVTTQGSGLSALATAIRFADE